MSPDLSDTPYPLEEVNAISYSFTTDHNIQYVVGFIDITQQYTKADIGDSVVYEYMFAPVGVQDRKLPVDTRVMTTVIDSISRAMNRSANVIMYICDYSDGRQNTRAKIFDKSFQKFAGQGLVKIDGMVRVSRYDDIETSASVIMSADNPDKAKIEYTFTEVLFHTDISKDPN